MENEGDPDSICFIEPRWSFRRQWKNSLARRQRRLVIILHVHLTFRRVDTGWILSPTIPCFIAGFYVESHPNLYFICLWNSSSSDFDQIISHGIKKYIGTISNEFCMNQRKARHRSSLFSCLYAIVLIDFYSSLVDDAKKAQEIELCCCPLIFLLLSISDEFMDALGSHFEKISETHSLLNTYI